jgi:hypothetical protein
VQGLIAAAIVGVAAEIVAFVFYAVSSSPRPSILLTSRIGIVLFYLFHHVGMVFDASNLTITEQPIGSILPPGSGLSLTAAVALLGGTVAVGLLLYRAGRIVGKKVDGPAWMRGLHGMKVAATYAAVSALATLAVHFTVHLPRSPVASGSFSIRPSIAAAVLWPLVFGMVFGFTGGFRSGDAGREREPESMRRARGVVAGGWRMLLAGMLLSYGGLLALSVVKPAARPIAYNIPTSGANEAVAGSVLTVLTIPNRAALALYPSMGSCVGVFAGAAGADVSFCAVSYSHFPTASALARISAAGAGGNGIPSLPAAPGGYLLFLLVPAASTVAGGLLAARRSKAQDRRVGAAVGALAGVVFALLTLAVGILATLSVKIVGHVQSLSGGAQVRLGPDLLIGTLIALAWGLAGGAVGGVIRPGSPAFARPAGDVEHYGFAVSSPPIPPPPPGPEAPPGAPGSPPEAPAEPA